MLLTFSVSSLTSIKSVRVDISLGRCGEYKLFSFIKWLMTLDPVGAARPKKQRGRKHLISGREGTKLCANFNLVWIPFKFKLNDMAGSVTFSPEGTNVCPKADCSTWRNRLILAFHTDAAKGLVEMKIMMIVVLVTTLMTCIIITLWGDLFGPVAATSSDRVKETIMAWC